MLASVILKVSDAVATIIVALGVAFFVMLCGYVLYRTALGIGWIYHRLFGDPEEPEEVDYD